MSGLTSYYYYEDRVITPATHQYRVYHADEADKVIAKLENENERLKKQSSCTFSDDCLRVRLLKADYKEACDRLQTANLIKDEQLAATRHSKRKRCLAMYRYCSIKALYELDFKGNDVEWKWYSKWMHKWFKLAEQLKEAK